MYVTFVIVCGLLFAHASQMNPNIRPSKSGINKRTTHKETAETKNNPPNPGDTFNSLAVQTPHADNEQKDPYDPRKDSWYRAYLVFTVLGVVGGLIGLAALIRQTMATSEAADAAKNSADALVKSQCAWLILHLYWLPGYCRFRSTAEGNIELFIEGVLTNSGQTPGWITEFRYCGALVDQIPEKPDFESIKEYAIEPETLEAHSKSDPISLIYTAIGPASGSKRLIVYGMIRYRDAFGHTDRKTTFGYWVTDHPSDQAELRRIKLAAYNQNT